MHEHDDDIAMGETLDADEHPSGLDSVEQELKAMLDEADLGQPAPGLLRGETIGGTYTIVGELGEGGMGRVYLAEHARTGGQVALKLIKSSRLGNGNALRRFELEAKHTAALHHPNIVRVFDYGQDDDLFYLAMEYVPGRSLEDLLRDEGPLDWRRAVEIAEQTLKALAAAHESDRQLIHRDIKPANIILTDDDTFVKVLDFGIARALDGPAATTQGIIGSPQTMAPEQFDGGPITPATDLYALGCTTYAMLTGRPPFDGTFSQLAMKHCHEDPAPLDVTEGDVPNELVDWVQWAMAKDPADRPPDAQSALAGLRGARTEAETHRGVAGASPMTRGLTGPRRIVLAGLALVAVALAVVWWVTPRPDDDEGEVSAPSLTAPAPADRATADADSAARAIVPTENITTIEGFEDLGPTSRLELSGQGNFLAYNTERQVRVLTLSTRATTTIDVPAKWTVGTFSWFPDGARLLVTLRTPEDTELWTVHLLDRRWEPLLGGARAGRVSHSGDRLAFLQNNALYVSSADGTDSRNVTQFPLTALISDVRWFDANTLVVGFADPGREDDDLAKIVAVDVDSGETSEILSDSRLSMMMSFRVALIGNRIIYNWRVAGFHGGQLRALTIDPITRAPVGEPQILLDESEEGFGYSRLSASRDGKLTYVKTRFAEQYQVIGIERSPVRFTTFEPLSIQAPNAPTSVAWLSEEEFLTADMSNGFTIDRWNVSGRRETVLHTDGYALFPGAIDGHGALLAFRSDEVDSTRAELVRFGSVDALDRPPEFATKVPFPHSSGARFKRLEPGIECITEPTDRCFYQRFLPGRIEIFEVTDNGLSPRPLVSIAGPTPPPYAVDIGGTPPGILIVYPQMVRIHGLDGEPLRTWRPPPEHQGRLFQWARWDPQGGFFVTGQFADAPRYRTLHVDDDGQVTIAHDNDWLALHDASPDGNYILAHGSRVDQEVQLIDVGRDR